MRWRPPPGLDRRAIAQPFVTDAVATAPWCATTATPMTVDVSGVRAADVDMVAHELALGPLEFREVIETAEMAELPAVLELGPRDPSWARDEWRSAGEAHRDTYLIGPSPAALDAMFAAARRRGWSLPAGTHVAYEHVISLQQPSPRGDSCSRSYVVAHTVGLDGTARAHAYKTYDANTERPQVMVEFDEQGTARFAELTRRIRGHKLATLVGDEVRSAPSINDRIAGGRASVTMGAADPDEAERAVDALVAVLHAGPLPRGGELVDVAYEPGTDASWLGWLLRAAYALAMGALVGGAAWLVVEGRAAGAGRGAAAPAGRASTLPRVLWTLLGCFVVSASGVGRAARHRSRRAGPCARARRPTASPRRSCRCSRSVRSRW